MAKDYYVILGVPVDAAPLEIRSAFRKLVLLHHPDRRRGSSPGRFQDITEAYGVLSDPAQRARYDALYPRPRPALAAPEPLTSEPVPIVGVRRSVRPSHAALLDRLMRNFLDEAAPKAERRTALDFELVLSPEEARRGVLVPFEVPVLSTCRHCGGLGRDWPFSCDECEGKGRVVDHEAVNVSVPARVRDGTVIEVSLEKLGIRNLWLRVHARIAKH